MDWQRNREYSSRITSSMHQPPFRWKARPQEWVIHIIQFNIYTQNLHKPYHVFLVGVMCVWKQGFYLIPKVQAWEWWCVVRRRWDKKWRRFVLLVWLRIFTLNLSVSAGDRIFTYIYTYIILLCVIFFFSFVWLFSEIFFLKCIFIVKMIPQIQHLSFLNIVLPFFFRTKSLYCLI